jgi:hypothetical protein
MVCLGLHKSPLRQAQHTYRFPIIQHGTHWYHTFWFAGADWDVWQFYNEEKG